MAITVISENGKPVLKTSLLSASTDLDSIDKKIIVTSEEVVTDVITIASASFDCIGTGKLTLSGGGSVTFSNIAIIPKPHWFGAVGDGTTDDTAALVALAASTTNTIDCGGKTYLVTNTSGLTNLENIFYNVGGVVTTVGKLRAEIKPSVSYYGGQLKALAEAIANPFQQELNITLIGDSITWGVGASGTNTVTVASVNLNATRDNSDSGSWANNFKRYIKNVLGTTVTETMSNHASSLSGESIATYEKTINISPRTELIQYNKTGSGSVAEATSYDAGTLLYVRRGVAVPKDPTSAQAEYTFQFTGSEFTLVFSAITNGAHYTLFVNGVQVGGEYTTRADEDGLTFGYSRTRTHTFDRVVDKQVKIIIFGVGAGDSFTTNTMNIEAIQVVKTVRIKNNGISGATSTGYFKYNFPVSIHGTPTYTAPVDYVGLVETPTGTTNITIRPAATLTGTQTYYGHKAASSWDLVVSVAADKELFFIGYSCQPNGSYVQVIVDSVVLGGVETSSQYPGNTLGYMKVFTQSLPAGTTEVTLRTVFNAAYQNSIGYNYFAVEGFANATAAEVSGYPTDNSYGKGIATEVTDDFVFFMLGTNDRINSVTIAKSAMETYYNLGLMMEVIPPDSKAIVMCSVVAANNSSPTYYCDMYEISAILRKFAKDYGYDFIDHVRLFGEAPTTSYLADGTHPNDYGHKMIAEHIKFAIENC